MLIYIMMMAILLIIVAEACNGIESDCPWHREYALQYALCYVLKLIHSMFIQCDDTIVSSERVYSDMYYNYITVWLLIL